MLPTLQFKNLPITRPSAPVPVSALGSRFRKEGVHELLQSEVPKEVRDRPSVWVRRRRAAVRLQG